MKVICPCGDVVVDQTDKLPNKAYLRPDEDDHDYKRLLVHFATLAARAHRAAPHETAEAVLLDMVVDVTFVGVRFEHAMYECTSCGRLLLFHPVSKDLVVYAPEGPSRSVLRTAVPT